MKLSFTAKRLVRSVASLAVLVMCGSAFAAANAIDDADYVQDFEADSVNGPAWTVGADVASGTGYDGWYGNTNSVILATNSTPGVSHPLTPTANAQVLKLDTEGAVLTNLVSMTDDIATNVFVDMLAYLVPSEDDPASITNDTTIQAAVYLNSSSNLVVWNGGVNGGANAFTPITATAVEPQKWYQLTIVMDYKSGDKVLAPPADRSYFKVQIDGADLTSLNAYSAPGVTGAFDGGSWFRTANANLNQITSVAFQGTGMIDEMSIGLTGKEAVTASYTITSVVSGPGSVDVASITVPSGTATQVTFTSDNAAWYEITAFEEDGSPVPAAVGQTVYTRVYASVAQSYSNDVVFGDITGYGGVPASWYTQFGSTGAQNEDGDSLDLDEEFALYTDPTVSNEFEIIEIDIDGSDYPFVKWLSDGDAEGNGSSIAVSNTTDLAGGVWAEVTGNTVHADGTNTWTSSSVAVPTAVYKVIVSQ